MSIDFVVGGPARDDDFVFRQSFVEELWETLEKQNVLLLAPRRMGKTSVMYRLLDQPQDDWLVIHLNAETLETPAEFFIELIDALNEHQPDFVHKYLSKSWGFLGDVLGRIEGIEAFDFKITLRRSEDWEKTWRERATQLIERIRDSGRSVLFIVDELPDMLTAMKQRSSDELKMFLHCFRDIRQSPKAVKLRWLVGGSVNIRGTLDEEGFLPLINDFQVEVLPPFTESEVEKFVSMMFEERNVGLDGEVIPRIQSLLGSPIPLFLQLLSQELYRHWKRIDRQKLSATHVDHVFQHALLGEAARDKLQHFHSRIRLHYPEQEHEAAYDLLDHLSLSESGVSRNTLFNRYRQMEDRKSEARKGQALKTAFQHLLWRLQSDFYIEEVTDNTYDFDSRLLKVWWKKNYGYESE